MRAMVIAVIWATVSRVSSAWLLWTPLFPHPTPEARSDVPGVMVCPGSGPQTHSVPCMRVFDVGYYVFHAALCLGGSAPPPAAARPLCCAPTGCSPGCLGAWQAVLIALPVTPGPVGTCSEVAEALGVPASSERNPGKDSHVLWLRANGSQAPTGTVETNAGSGIGNPQGWRDRASDGNTRTQVHTCHTDSHIHTLRHTKHTCVHARMHTCSRTHTCVHAHAGAHPHPECSPSLWSSPHHPPDTPAGGGRGCRRQARGQRLGWGRAPEEVASGRGWGGRRWMDCPTDTSTFRAGAGARGP